MLGVLGPMGFMRAERRCRRSLCRVEDRMMESAARTDEITELTKFIGRCFTHACPSVEMVEWTIHAHIGANEGQRHCGVASIWWETSIGILVYIGGRPSLGLGLEFDGPCLHIRQLQGAEGITLDPALRRWPRYFVAACREYVRETSTLNEVRVSCADDTPFYYDPILSRWGAPGRKAKVEDCRRRLRRRYDGTARQLGFEKCETYYRWVKPTLVQP